MSEEAGQEFYCAGHPKAVFCAPVLTAEEAAPLRCSKTTSGRRQGAPLARRSEFLPSLEALPINLGFAKLMGNASLTHPTLLRCYPGNNGGLGVLLTYLFKWQ